MKKLISVFLLIFTVAFVGCSQKVTYSEKFDYLPIIPGSELVSFEEGEGKAPNKAPDKAEYILKETTMDKASSDYKDLLTNNGWTFSETESEESLYKFTKDKHWAIIMFDKSDNDVKFTIVSI